MGYLDSPVGMNERKSMLWPWRLWKTTMILNGNWSANRGFSDLFMWISWGKCMKVRWYQVPTKMSIQWQTGNQTYWGTIMAPKAIGGQWETPPAPWGDPQKEESHAVSRFVSGTEGAATMTSTIVGHEEKGPQKIDLSISYIHIYIYTHVISYINMYMCIYIHTYICYIIYKYMLYYIYVYYIIIL